MSYFISEIEYGTPEYDECLKLRHVALRAPLGLEFTTKQIELEYSFFHFACYSLNHALLGYLMMVPNSHEIVQMKQVVVDASVRNQGYGKHLVEYAEHWAAGKSFHKIFLHARAEAKSFYKRLGYLQVGEPFEEVSILHYEMEKVLS
jgi:predicted GNAT family N-acyltransferase